MEGLSDKIRKPGEGQVPITSMEISDWNRVASRATSLLSEALAAHVGAKWMDNVVLGNERMTSEAAKLMF